MYIGIATRVIVLSDQKSQGLGWFYRCSGADGVTVRKIKKRGQVF